MFYSNNDGYMQDLYFYNQTPSNAYMFSNPMMINSNAQVMQQGGMFNFPQNQNVMNPGVYFNNTTPPNLNNLYPSIYKILNPVISRVVLNNKQPITEELLNNMTDTVFNIVEGQIDYGDDQVQSNINNETQQINSNSSNNRGLSSELNRSNNHSSSNNVSNSKHNKEDLLLKDFIKILTIKEIFMRNNFQRCCRK